MSAPFIRDPHEWMREQEQRTAGLLAKAQDAQSRLAENTVTHTSPDRAVTVTVNPGGGLTTYNQAARQAATQTMEIMAGLVGQDSEALDIVRQAMPELPETGQDERLDGLRRPPTTTIDDEDGFQGFNGGGDRG